MVGEAAKTNGLPDEKRPSTAQRSALSWGVEGRVAGQTRDVKEKADSRDETTAKQGLFEC